MSYHIEFFKQLDQFKDQIVKLLVSKNRLNEVKLLNDNYAKMLALKAVNTLEVIRLFHTHVISKYANEIKTKDEVFFLKKEINDIKLDNTDIDIIDHVKLLWIELDPDTKSNIWKYIQILAILSDKTMGKNMFAV
jgi:hypothetical protein